MYYVYRSHLKRGQCVTNLITKARELCEKATPGEWKVNHLDDCFIEPRICEIPANGCYDYKMVEANSMFISRSRTLIPELCDALEKAEAEIEKMKPFYKIADDTFRHWENAAYAMRDDERKKHRWIPVTERLPQPNVDALVLTDAGSIRQGYIGHATGHWCSGGLVMVPTVTHWQPLPAPPEEGAEE